MRLTAILAFLSIFGVTLTLAKYYDNHGNQHNIGDIELNMDIDDDIISLTWKVNSTDSVYGFKVVIKDADELYMYESPVLNKHAKNMVLHQELDEGDVSVCLLVLLNTSHMIAEKCEEATTSSMQMVVGILAGVVFLVPCVAALTFIIYKDRQVLRRPSCDQSETKVLIKPVSNIKAVVIDDEKPQTSKATSGKVNECFEAELESIDLESETKSVKSETSRTANTELTSLSVDMHDREKAQQNDSKEKLTTDKVTAKTVDETDTSKRKSSKKSSVYVIRL